MTHRGQITDKCHRVCKDCGQKIHVNAIRGPDTYECEGCGGTQFTRNKTHVRGVDA